MFFVILIRTNLGVEVVVAAYRQVRSLALFEPSVSAHYEQINVTCPIAWQTSNSAACRHFHLHGPRVGRFRAALCHSFSAEFEPSVFVRLAQRRQSLLLPCTPANVIQRASSDDVYRPGCFCRARWIKRVIYFHYRASAPSRTP